MYKLLEQLEKVKDAKSEHMFKCDQCNNVHKKIDSDYCGNYKDLMSNLKVIQSLIDDYKIDIR